jgi:hypothetical protein
MKAIIIASVVGVALAVTAAVTITACDDSAGEMTTPAPSPAAPAETAAADTPTAVPTDDTPTPPPGGAGGGGEQGTPVPVATPEVSPEPAPAGWHTYTDPEGRFSFRYPEGWYDLTNWLGMPSVASWDQQSWQQRDYPPGAIRVDLTVGPIEEGVSERPPEAMDATLDTEAGWQFGYAFDPSLGPARNHALVVDHDGYRFMLIGWFADEHPDETTFLAIARSFHFTQELAAPGQ